MFKQLKPSQPPAVPLWSSKVAVDSCIAVNKKTTLTTQPLTTSSPQVSASSSLWR